jgi:hypothetical protein
MQTSDFQTKVSLRLANWVGKKCLRKGRVWTKLRRHLSTLRFAVTSSFREETESKKNVCVGKKREKEKYMRFSL